jgi:hypothetical protein
MRRAQWPLAFVALVSFALVGYVAPSEEQDYISKWTAEIAQLEMQVGRFAGDRAALVKAIDEKKIDANEVGLEKLQKMDLEQKEREARLAEVQFMYNKLTSTGMPWYYMAAMGVCLLAAIVSSVDARKARRRLAQLEQAGVGEAESQSNES